MFRIARNHIVIVKVATIVIVIAIVSQSKFFQLAVPGYINCDDHLKSPSQSAVSKNVAFLPRKMAVFTGTMKTNLRVPNFQSSIDGLGDSGYLTWLR